MAVRYLCYSYWEKHDTMVDYFLLHDFMAIALEYYQDDGQRIIPCDNAMPHILLLRLFEKYDEKIWNILKEQIPFHKLSYKFNDGQDKIEGTYYRKIFG